MSKKVLVVSDTHVGSMVGLMPPKVKLADPAGTVPIAAPSNDQRKLLNCWKDMIKNVGPVDMVIHCGDIIDGCNQKERGLGQWSTSMHDQVHAAVELLQMIRFKDSKPSYIIADGTKYHAGVNPSGDVIVAEELGLGRLHYGREVRIEVEGHTIHVAHKIGVSLSTYRSTALARERIMDAITADVKKYKSDLLIRGHAHYYYMVRDRNGAAFISPCWQFRTDYMAILGIGVQPEIGYTVLNIDADGIDINTTLIPLASPTRAVKV